MCYCTQLKKSLGAGLPESAVSVLRHLIHKYGLPAHDKGHKGLMPLVSARWDTFMTDEAPARARARFTRLQLVLAKCTCRLRVRAMQPTI